MFFTIPAFCCLNPKLTKYFPNLGIHSLSDGTKLLILPICTFSDL